MDPLIQAGLIYGSRALVLLLCLPVHELAHAYAARSLGDPTAEQAGRLSLNPFRHLDPIGAICMFALGVGWARPVPVDMRRFSHPKRDMAFVLLMGPCSNLLLALIGMMGSKVVYLLLLLHPSLTWLAPARWVFYEIASINVMLAVFNLLPVPPLDGSRLLMACLPEKAYAFVARYERYSMLLLFILLLFGIFTPILSFCTDGLMHVLDVCTSFLDVIGRILVGG